MYDSLSDRSLSHEFVVHNIIRRLSFSTYHFAIVLNGNLRTSEVAKHYTLPETNVAASNQWRDDQSPYGMTYLEALGSALSIWYACFGDG